MSVALRRGLRVDDPLAGPTTNDDERQGPPSMSSRFEADESRLRDIELERIRANPSQPRRRFDQDALAALAESIRERGVLQPVIVRPITDGYELVAGERRWRAAQLAGESTIPALVDDELDDAGSLELALIENIAREDLTAIEQARTLAVLLQNLRMTSTVLSRRLGRSRSDIANTVRLLELPDEAIEMIDSAVLSKGHGKALLSEPDHHRRREFARQAAVSGWSVRVLEEQIARPVRTTARQEPPADHVAAAERLQGALATATGCDVRAVPHAHGFRITLDQAAADGLLRLLADGVPSP
jgi:ParB family transcriptional regulator, chromosome partitioning protein